MVKHLSENEFDEAINEAQKSDETTARLPLGNLRPVETPTKEAWVNAGKYVIARRGYRIIRIKERRPGFSPRVRGRRCILIG